MNARPLSKIAIVLLALSVTACAGIQLSDVTAVDVRSASDCRYNQAIRNEGFEICQSLMRVEDRFDQLDVFTAKQRDRRYDYGLIGAGILSSAALASNAHVSVLEGLGIGTAAIAGIKTYSNVTSERAAIDAAKPALTCLMSAKDLTTTARGESYDDLLLNIDLLRNARAQLATLLSVGGLSAEITEKLGAATTPANEALNLAREATTKYAMTGTLINQKRSEIDSKMMQAIQAGRGDVNAIVASILAAEAAKRSKDAATDAAAAGVDAAAAEVAPDPQQPAALQGQVKSLFDSGPRTLALRANDLESLFDSIEAVVDNEDRAIEVLEATSYSMQKISSIAPGLIKAHTAVEACTYN